LKPCRSSKRLLEAWSDPLSALERNVTLGYAEAKTEAANFNKAQTADLARGCVDHCGSPSCGCVALRLSNRHSIDRPVTIAGLSQSVCLFVSGKLGALAL